MAGCIPMGPRHTSCWLVVNEASGSNDDGTVSSLREQLERIGRPVAREFCFPKEGMPTPDALVDAGNPLVVIFTGDGSIKALIEALAGWAGQVLVLPGGTMNLLSHRLHGDRDARAILDRVAAGEARVRRPNAIECDEGLALSGVLVGPGTEWNRVREAMRGADLAEFAAGSIAAIAQSASGPRVYCRTPSLGRADGYVLLLLTPEDDSITVDGYHADTIGEFAQQGAALMQRDFRQGPHETLGRTDRLLVAQHGDAAKTGVLVDGEPADMAGELKFRLVPSPVDLLATA